MNRLFFFLSAFVVITVTGCRNDESHQVTPRPGTPGVINLDITGRIGTRTGENLTDYVKSMTLLLFRESPAGDYLLARSISLNKNDLEALNVFGDGDAGFTVPRKITFDTVTIGNYRVVGVGNVTDSTGVAVSDISLSNVRVGESLSQILVQVANGSLSPRLFWGITDVITAGAAQPLPPVLKLYRKVSMFALTVKKVPAVVKSITMQIRNTTDAFNMLGTFSGNAEPIVDITNYVASAGDSVTLTYVVLPTVSGQKSDFEITFYIEQGDKKVITLPSYVLKENTITKLTATIDVEGDHWKVDFGAIITVNVEWNVDQEPPVTI